MFIQNTIDHNKIYLISNKYDLYKNILKTIFFREFVIILNRNQEFNRYVLKYDIRICQYWFYS